MVTWYPDFCSAYCSVSSSNVNAQYPSIFCNSERSLAGGVKSIRTDNSSPSLTWTVAFVLNSTGSRLVEDVIRAAKLTPQGFPFLRTVATTFLGYVPSLNRVESRRFLIIPSMREL